MPTAASVTPQADLDVGDFASDAADDATQTVRRYEYDDLTLRMLHGKHTELCAVSGADGSFRIDGLDGE